MFAQFYAHMRWNDLPLLALFIFLGTFVASVVRVTLLKKRADLDPLARLPLDDGIIVRVADEKTTRKEVLL